MSTFELTAESRDALGKGNTRRMRRNQDRLPAIIYGAGKAPETISLSQTDMMVAMKDEAFFSHILTINVGGKKQQVVIKALQRHPYKNIIMHADFLRINAKDKITMTVPLHFINEEQAPGVKASGVVSHMMTELEIRCLPSKLPEFIEIDMAAMELDAVVHLSDIKLPKGVELVQEITEDNNQAVVSIHKAHTEAAEDTTDDAAEGETASEE